MIALKPLKTIVIPVLFLALAQIAQAGRDNLFLIDLDDPAVMRNIGIWEHNLFDSEQSLKVDVMEGKKADEKKGRILRLDFDVDSPNPAMVGCWLKFENLDLSEFDTLRLKIRSGEAARFAGNLALQFTDVDNKKAPYLITGIGTDWKEFQVPLKKFNRIHDWSRITGFEIIIDDINARPKEGTLFVDEISVSRGGS